jgi:hypothetical protein
MRSMVPELPEDMNETSQPIELSKLMLMKTEGGASNTTSFDDTVFNGVSLASGTYLEDGTIQDESIIDYDDNDDDQSESSLTLISYDSTYLSEGTEGGCGIRQVLLHDLNDAVEDVREGVMDMVAAVRNNSPKEAR